MTSEQQYLSLMQSIIDTGSEVYNQRTKSNTLTIPSAYFQYKPDEFPLVTTRKSYFKQAIMEMICYMRGYTELEQFHELGVNTWNANAENWDSKLNPNKDRVGIIYGASSEAVGISYADIVLNIIKNPTDRGHVWNFWNPEYFKLGCLRPCMYSHQFSVIGDTLYLHSTQRSCDVPLGLNFNMIQVWFLGFITAHLTRYKFGGATHSIINPHIYANQIEGVKEQLKREPYNPPNFHSAHIFLEDILRRIDKDNFEEFFWITDYQYHPPIYYPFTA